MNAPDDLKYTKSDEWVRVEGDTVTMGVSDYAQDALNDIVYVELPEIGNSVDKGDSVGSIESVKAASDIYAPISGEIIEVNEALEDEPELINAEPYGKGWIVKFKADGDLDLSDLMDAAGYSEYCESR